MRQPVCRRRGQPRGSAPGSTGHGAVLEPAESSLCSAVPPAVGTRSGTARQPGAHVGCGQARATDSGVSNRGIFVHKAALPFLLREAAWVHSLHRPGGRKELWLPPDAARPGGAGLEDAPSSWRDSSQSIPMSRERHVCLRRGADTQAELRVWLVLLCCPTDPGGSPRGDLPFPLSPVSHGRCWLHPLSQPLHDPQKPRDPPQDCWGLNQSVLPNLGLITAFSVPQFPHMDGGRNSHLQPWCRGRTASVMEGSCGGLVMETVICSGRSLPMTSRCWATSRGLGEMSLKEAELTDPRAGGPPSLPPEHLCTCTEQF